MKETRAASSVVAHLIEELARLLQTPVLSLCHGLPVRSILVRAQTRIMHPLILLGLILVAGIFAGLGALVLRLTPRPGLRWSSLISFVVSALVGAAAYTLAYLA